MGTSPLTSRELVERLWDDVRKRERVVAKTTVPELPVRDVLMHGEALRYINTYWEGRPPSPPAGDPSGRLGSVKARARARLARFVISLFADYLEADRQFNANIARVSNAVASGHDDLANEVRQLAEAIRTESQRLTDEFEVLHRLLETRVAALERSTGTAPGP